MSTTGPETTFQSTNELIRDGVPDWEAIKFEVHCSRCGYNLRTLSRPKCTECGFDFDWKRLVLENAFHNSHLFEHEWAKRPFGAIGYVLYAPLFVPTRFWRRISLDDQVDGFSLWVAIGIALCALVGLCFVFINGGAFLLSEFCKHPTISEIRWKREPVFASSVVEILNQYQYGLARLSRNFEDPVGKLLLVFAGFASSAVMMVFLSCLRGTLARFKLRNVHMLRIVAYSSFPTFFYSAILIALCPLFEVLTGNIESYGGLAYVIIVGLLFVIPWFVPIRVAFREYLQLPRPGLSALLAALIMVLILVAPLAVINS